MKLLPIALAVLACSALAAEEAEKKTVFTGGVGSFPNLGSCEMTFNAGWKDVVNAGQIQVKVVTDDQAIKVLATGANVGAANALLPVEGEFLSLIDPNTLQPKAMEQTEKRQGKVLLSAVQFGDGVVSVKKSLNPGGDEEALGYEAEFKTARAFDLVSGALFIRSLPLTEVGEEYTIAIVPQSTPQPFTVKVVGKEPYEYQGEEISAIKLTITPAKADIFTDKSAEKEDEDKEKSPEKTKESAIKEQFKGALGAVTAWISDDDRRLPLEASVEVKPIGAVSVKLVEFNQ